MITIAGGILLAIAILASLPAIITGVAWCALVLADRGKWLVLVIVWLVVMLGAK